MALSAQNQSTSYVNLYYSIVQRAATRYFKEYYNSGEYQQTTILCHPTSYRYILSFSEIELLSNRCPNQPKRKVEKKKKKEKKTQSIIVDFI